MTNKSEALDMAEDVFLTRALAEGLKNEQAAAMSDSRSALMARAAKRIDDQAQFIKNLQHQLSVALHRAVEAEQELIGLRERNAESVAVANSAALTLRQAVNTLVSEKRGTEAESNYFLRTLRTKNYNSQIDKLIEKGLLKQDPRQTLLIKERSWYVESPTM